MFAVTMGFFERAVPHDLSSRRFSPPIFGKKWASRKMVCLPRLGARFAMVGERAKCRSALAYFLSHPELFEALSIELRWKMRISKQRPELKGSTIFWSAG
jgi:hypothetical protein